MPHAFADPTELYRTCTVDAIVIAKPNYLHNPLAILTLAHGCHVFCKKTPALTYAQAREMAEEAARRVTLAYNFQLRQYLQFEHLLRCQAERL